MQGNFFPSTRTALMRGGRGRAYSNGASGCDRNSKLYIDILANPSQPPPPPPDPCSSLACGEEGECIRANAPRVGSSTSY